VYQGKRLYENLCGFRWDGIGLGDALPFEISIVSIAPSQQRDEACQALRQLGTNALPLIYHCFRAKPSPIDKLLNLARVRWRSGLMQLSSGERRMAGITAFGQLAATAKPLLAEMIPLLNDPSYAAFVVPAVQGIGLQGEEQILALTNAFKLRYFVTDMHVLAALGSHGAKAAGAIPLIIE